MSDCNTKLRFVFNKNKRIEGDFSGGDLSSDGGLLLLRELDDRLSFTEKFSAKISDPRSSDKIKHSQSLLIRQRIYQICAGYEDANDSNSLRHDPVMKMSCHENAESLSELASQPTITRLENRITLEDIRELRRFFVEQYLSSFKSEPESIVLDIDSWSDETHGNQEQTFFHGFYEHYMYHPVMVNDANTGYPLLLHLRPGNSHSGKGVKSLLRWLFYCIRKRFPNVRIILRGDGGFSLPEIISLCENSEIDYVFGYAKNAVLERKIVDLAEQARLHYIQTNQKARLFGDTYYMSGSWNEPRRIIMKAEHSENGTNHRFLVTNLSETATWVYSKFYVQRAEDSENRIKELKLDIKSDRLSCHKFIANQFRLFLHQAAYWLMQRLKQLCLDTQFTKARIVTLREKILKLAVRVRHSARRVFVQFASSCPIQKLFTELLCKAQGSG
jgi:Transposase DDE domain group 1